MLTHEGVIDLARNARVAPDPAFHGRSAHGITFEKLAAQLLFTFRVEKDRRPAHPKGYVAFTQNWGGEVYRVDFNLHEDGQGEMILIVTGWKKEEIG